MVNRIEFYKNRSIGERFSAAIDFLKQNWKVLYKNIIFGGLPLALILAYFLARQQSYTSSSFLGSLSGSFSSGIAGIIINMALLYIFMFLNIIYLYSMTGAILLHYDRNKLTETTGWSDLQTTFFQLAGKTVLISLVVFIPVVIIVTLVAAIFGFSFSAFSPGGAQALSVLVLVLVIFLFIGALIALAPPLTIIYYPAYFSGKSIMESVKIAFKLGFQNWGSLFVAILLVGLVSMIISVIFSMPLQLTSYLSMFAKINVSFIVSYILGILSAAGTLLLYPVMFLIFAFQYFSIVEKEEGISLQSQVSDFENL
jgi:hypothetical protein